MKTHEKENTTSYFPQNIDIGDIYINYLHKIILIRLEKNKILTDKDNLKVHLVVGISSINICFRKIL